MRGGPAQPRKIFRVEAKVFLYDSGMDQPFTSGRNAAPQDILAKAGGDNTPEEKQRFLESYAPLANLPAIEAFAKFLSQ
ncbi:hypothetical protein FKR81_39320 [Lentzea tibetensis]|uniref:Uncharacterized protein n=1 Tax=Lentzea tibetensis TaxID=2591470 RepID=A0A563EGK4_9PSEU|nr:hypothetical protein [Lentzea tibetensis]TWP45473.1 hypothetical protein FKR81_39320 [Lentzea tibetensis]